MNIPRRQFAIRSLTCTGLFALSMQGAAQSQEPLAESDPLALALGYRVDSTKVDPKKNPNHSPSQRCGGCALFQGKAIDALGACPVVSNKLVHAKGWCSAWTKRA